MKTLLIYSDFEGLAKFGILEGDFSHLQGTIINMCAPKGEDKAAYDNKCDELSNLLYDHETGKELLEFSDDFPTEEVFSYAGDGGFKIITVGFLP